MVYVPSSRLPFMKMHGLGNDFVVIDARLGEVHIDNALVREMGDRHFGVGFDQLAVMTSDAEATIGLTFYNVDGSLAGACGNATRCVARYLFEKEISDNVMTIRTERGLLVATCEEDGTVAVNMGHPQLVWNKVPLAREMDTLFLPIDGTPTATGMGNPHCTFFVEDVAALRLEDFAQYEHHPLYPERTNVQIAQIIGRAHIRMRVWERGTGVTLASGSSSCAVAVAAARRGFTDRNVRITLDGGDLQVDWREDGVWMSGPTAYVFDGIWYG